MYSKTSRIFIKICTNQSILWSRSKNNHIHQTCQCNRKCHKEFKNIKPIALIILFLSKQYNIKHNKHRQHNIKCNIRQRCKKCKWLNTVNRKHKTIHWSNQWYYLKNNTCNQFLPVKNISIQFEPPIILIFKL